MAHFPSTVREGEVIAGKYHVLRVLGAGGMGTVVAARHLQLDELVAVKLLHPSTLQEAGAVARFTREARAAVKIKSEHVARVFDVGVLEGGEPYMVMEYLEGQDLASMLEKHGPLPVDLALTFVLQACEAIAEAHTLGIVHRDLKPANLFATRKPDGTYSIKVLDFGVSKFSNPTTTHPELALTSTMALVGSPLYVAPEQLREARGVDARADIWALGVITFQLLTNETPFHGVSIADLLVKIATAAPRPLSAFRRDVPPGVEAAVLKCLEKDRASRPADVGQFALSLAPYAPESAHASIDRVVRTLAAASGVQPLPAPVTDRPGTVPPWGRTLASAQSKASLLVAGAAVLLAAGAIALVSARGRVKRAVEAPDAGEPVSATNADGSAQPAPESATSGEPPATHAAAPSASSGPPVPPESPPSASAVPRLPGRTKLPRQKKLPTGSVAAEPARPAEPAPGDVAPAAPAEPIPEPYAGAGRSPYDDRK